MPLRLNVGETYHFGFCDDYPSDIDRLHQVNGFTAEEYEKYITAPAGTEHYALLHYLSKNYAYPEVATPSCKRRHLVDIGTRYAAASSLSMASDLHPPLKVMTFDIPNSKEQAVAFRGKTKQEWQDSVRAYNVDIQIIMSIC